MPVVRVKPDVACAVWSEDHAAFVSLTADMPFDSTDPIVRANPWAFESGVESATAKPGEKRSVRRPTSVSVAPAE